MLQSCSIMLLALFASSLAIVAIFRTDFYALGEDLKKLRLNKLKNKLIKLSPVAIASFLIFFLTQGEMKVGQSEITVVSCDKKEKTKTANCSLCSISNKLASK